MPIGVGLFLIALGAILLLAVSTTVAGVSINTIGVILLVVGGIGLLYALVVQAGRDEPRRPAA